MPKQPPNAEARMATLRDRALVILAAFDRTEPSPLWAQFREAAIRAKRVAELRSINQDLRGAMAGLPQPARVALERELADRFGSDEGLERDRGATAKIQARGQIRSEREYRVVQAYADSIAADSTREEEYLALGALLDDYMAASKLPNER